MTTPTELLIETMEEFGNSEAIDLVIIHTDAAKTVHVRSSCSLVTALGMMEWAKEASLRNSMKQSGL